MVIKDKFTKNKTKQKKSQFIYLLVLPKFKISSPTAKERKQTNIKSEKPLLIVTEQRRQSGTGGCREPAGEDGKREPPSISKLIIRSNRHRTLQTKEREEQQSPVLWVWPSSCFSSCQDILGQDMTYSSRSVLTPVSLPLDFTCSRWGMAILP